MKVREFLRPLVRWSDERDGLIGCQVMAAVDQYLGRYYREDVERYETRAVEIELVNDLVNPDTGRKSPKWLHVSKLDGLALDRFSNTEVVVEHKTSSEDLSDSSPYWRRLRMDSQISKYLLSLRQSGHHDASEVLYDVIAKPTTKPKQVVKADVRKIAESGVYFGFHISQADLASIRKLYDDNHGSKGGFTGELKESSGLYINRLRRLMMSAPSEWFRRRKIIRSDAELEEYARELWHLAGEVRESRRAGIHPRNTTHCKAYNSTCEFFELCCGELQLDSDRFTRPDFVHAEIETRTGLGDGRGVLTNSRLVMFQSCRRKHFFRYEEGVKADRDSIALRWGDLLHKCLELVWGSYKGESNGG